MSPSSTVDATSTVHSSDMINAYENKENITLVWFDPNIDLNEDTKQTKQRLRQMNDYVVFHTELESCVAYLCSIEKETIFLISSGCFASQLLSRIISLTQIHSIFIFCVHKVKYEYLHLQYPKIVDVFKTSE